MKRSRRCANPTSRCSTPESSAYAAPSYPAERDSAANPEDRYPYRLVNVALDAFFVSPKDLQRLKREVRKKGADRHPHEVVPGIGPVSVGEFPRALPARHQLGGGARDATHTLGSLSLESAATIYWPEFEYDATTRKSGKLELPSPVFDRHDPLLWDGHSAWTRGDGQTVFRCEAGRDGARRALSVRRDHLEAVIAKSGQTLVWLAHREKQFITGGDDGGNHEQWEWLLWTGATVERLHHRTDVRLLRKGEASS